ncbi:MAG: prepilin-type N-terminal cleavage/methylation domain-containing protein [Candidatus Riflebacteria bacterium]|nr:prepilin-type N-terminal cleavage/methylation domain-containing protein [Candidatus Riflebacteria bacterium]
MRYRGGKKALKVFASSRAASHGFSLVEIIITLSVLVVALVPLLRLMSSQAVSARDIRDHSIVMNLVEGQLHKYICIVNAANASSSICLVKEDITSEIVADHKGELGSLVNSLQMLVTVQVCPECPDHAYEILVEATWEKVKKFHLYTVVAERDSTTPDTGKLE